MSYWVTFVLYFIIYSFLGWCCETIYCTILQRKFVNRGFLYGPLCPIYGCGALLVIFLLRDVRSSIIPLFLSGMVVTTVLEYLTSVLMEKLFHMKWWDYSHLPFNINGRVCLLNSCEFGALSVFVIMVLHPAIVRLVGRIPVPVQTAVAGVLLAVMVVDAVCTVRGILILKGKLDDIYMQMDEIRLKTEEGAQKLRLAVAEKQDEVRGTLNSYTDDLKEALSVRAEILMRDLEMYREQLSSESGELQKGLEEGRQKITRLIGNIRQLEKSRRTSRHLFEAFPNLRVSENERFRNQIRQKLEHYIKQNKD